MMQEQKQISTLPGVFATLAAGFDLIAKHLWLLLIPVILDVFYWLGPRLRFQELIRGMLALLPEEADLLDVGSQLAELAPRTNLFTTLSVQLIGVPALMVGQVPEKTPLTPPVFEVSSWLNWIGLFTAFSLIGLFLTALLYTLVAYALSRDSHHSSPIILSYWAKRVGKSWIRLIGLVIIFFIIMMAIYIPLIVISTLLFLINSTLGTLFILAGPLILVWIAIFFFLAPFGIVLNNRPVLKALYESFRLVQANLASALLMLIAILLAGTVLDWILFAVENGTWLTFINILGHAFVSTSFIAALFIYYRDRYTSLFDPEKNTAQSAAAS
ncbi:MAG: hypothetical protein R3293_16280 [Candidatus Promineifilaceae bacterium]|nr:hypothetical protein [Candidatus Promineifilaceae bacterium]